MIPDFLGNIPFLSASLIDGFLLSNFMGKFIVLVQLGSSVLAGAIIIGKWKELNSCIRNSKAFTRAFVAKKEVLDYYLSRKKGQLVTLELIYTRTCERLVKNLDPAVRNPMISLGSGAPAAAFTAKEMNLLRGTCEHVADDEEIRIEWGMGMLASIVTASPMLGLLGTVWGVLDAFATMGDKGTVLLSEIAPAISSALLTTVIGLIVAIPSTICYNIIAGKIRQIDSDMDGFCEELIGRIALEYQGRDN